MASVVNFTSRNLLNKIFLTKCKPTSCRWVTTGSNNKKESSGEVGENVKLENVPDFTKPSDSKNWVSYGFDFENPNEDKYKMHSSFFLGTLCVMAFVFWHAYMPDSGHRHWARREAFIRLHEREKLGLDPIDKNYVDPAKMKLPTDEQLGDFEIVI